ncbi:hypothetical protein D3C72_2384390 [compost metagenome]
MLIAAEPGKVSGTWAGDATKVAVIGQISQFDLSRQRISACPNHKRLIALARTSTQREQGGEDFQRETLKSEV